MRPPEARWQRGGGLVMWAVVQGLLVLLAPCTCGGDLSLQAGGERAATACAWSTLKLCAHAVSYDIVGHTQSMIQGTATGSSTEQGNDLHSSIHSAAAEHEEVSDKPLGCDQCPCGATFGLARCSDGIWVKFLCSKCNDRRVSFAAGSQDVEALGLAGKCRQCRTKASYGVCPSPPQRCGRHKKACDIVRTLGVSCVSQGCQKARLFGIRGGVPLYCATHRLPDQIDVKNKRCQFHGCVRQASYGDSHTRMKIACAKHRLHWHVDLKHERKRCAAPEGCRKIGVFKRRLVAPPLSTAGPNVNPNAAEVQNRFAYKKKLLLEVQRGAGGRLTDGSAHPGEAMDGDLTTGARQSPQERARRCQKGAKEGGDKGFFGGWVFVCAAHLSLNVFSASSEHEVFSLAHTRTHICTHTHTHTHTHTTSHAHTHITTHTYTHTYHTHTHT